MDQVVVDPEVAKTGVNEGVAPVSYTPQETKPMQKPMPGGKPGTLRTKPKSSLARGLKDTKELAKNITYFDLRGPISTFLGKLEKKNKHSVVITLDAPAGSGKTRSVFQMLDMFADAGLYCVFASLEEHPESALFLNKVNEYIKPSNEKYIDTIGDLPDTYAQFIEAVKDHDVIAIDSWNKVFEKYKGIDFDNDLRKALDGKIIVTIFQRTSSGQMRGGSKAAFDGDIILEVEKKPSFKDSYLIARKNRYQNTPLDEIGYNFYHKKIINPSMVEKEEEQIFKGEIVI